MSTMVYGADVMLSMEINMPSWQQFQFNEEINKAELEYAADLIDKLKEVAHV